MTVKKKQEMDMINGPLLKNIFIFAVPLMLTNFLQNLFNAVDTIVVGRFAGEEALAAVGATGSLVFLMQALFMGISMGASVIVAQLIGKGDQEEVQKSVSTSYAMALICGVFVNLFALCMAHTMLKMTGIPDNIIHDSTVYMQIYFCGAVFMMIYNFGAGILRAKGDTKLPLLALAVSGLANVFISIFLVIALKKGVIGVAVGTVLSQFIAAIIVTVALVKTDDMTHLDLKKISLDTRIAGNILRIGVPAGIQSMMYSISNVVMQSSINSFNSSAVIAGNTAGNNIESFAYIAMFSFSQACITFTSQNYGAQKYDKLKRIMYVCLGLCVVGAMMMSGIIWIFRFPLLHLYTNAEDVVNYGLTRVIFVIMPLFLNGVLDVFVGSMRGMGYSTLPTILMIIGICGVRLLWLLAYFPLHRELYVIYLSFPISWAFTSIVEYILWLSTYHKLIKKTA